MQQPDELQPLANPSFFTVNQTEILITIDVFTVWIEDKI